MTNQTFSASLNDSSEFFVNLSWLEAAFEPGEVWSGIATFKRCAEDLDEDAVFQKATPDEGMTFSGSVAHISLIPGDSATLADGDRLVFSIRVRNTITEQTRTVAYADVYFMRDIAQSIIPSIPIYTSTPPANGALLVFNRIDGTYYQLVLSLAEGDPSGLPVLQYQPFSGYPVDYAAPLIVERSTGDQWLLFIDETDGDGVPVLQYELSIPA